MAIVGAFARVEASCKQEALLAIESLEGVSTFELDDPHKLGILMEAASLDAAHHLLRHHIESIDGVLGVWPAYANIEDELPEATTTQT